MASQLEIIDLTNETTDLSELSTTQTEPIRTKRIPFWDILNKEEPLKHILIFQLLITTGIRKGELAALHFE